MDADTTTPTGGGREVEPGASQRWKLSKVGKACFAELQVDCAGAECKAGEKQPHPCPTWADGAEIGLAAGATIEGIAGAAKCTMYQPDGCPEDADCNPPPPMDVTCPKS